LLFLFWAQRRFGTGFVRVDGRAALRNPITERAVGNPTLKCRGFDLSILVRKGNSFFALLVSVEPMLTNCNTRRLARVVLLAHDFIVQVDGTAGLAWL
jgi:hypothetical protein